MVNLCVISDKINGFDLSSETCYTYLNAREKSGDAEYESETTEDTHDTDYDHLLGHHDHRLIYVFRANREPIAKTTIANYQT
jgi:hypothetical protein